MIEETHTPENNRKSNTDKENRTENTEEREKELRRKEYANRQKCQGVEENKKNDGREMSFVVPIVSREDKMT